MTLWHDITVTKEEGQGSHTKQSFNVKWVTGKHVPENPKDQAKVDIVELSNGEPGWPRSGSKM